MHDLLCYRTLAEAAGLPTQVRARLVPKLRRVASVTVERDPARWGEYCLTPAVAVPSPQSCLYGSIEQAALDTHLDLLVSNQLKDGSWPVSWSWEEVDAEAWACAEREWKGHLTLVNLLTLRAYGRFPQ